MSEQPEIPPALTPEEWKYATDDDVREAGCLAAYLAGHRNARP